MADSIFLIQRISINAQFAELYFPGFHKSDFDSNELDGYNPQADNFLGKVIPVTAVAHWCDFVSTNNG
jgi:hypothetical protein